MTPRQIELVQTSFQKVIPISATAADMFYDRLFEVTPDVRGLFPDDLTDQKEKLMVMLTTAVTNLHQLYTVMPAVRALGKRHVDYGVKPEHYALVGGALLWTLEKGLGPDFTPDVRAAWTEAYTALAGVMTGAA
jgi:hemoglobin-like flavoprotein